MGRHYLDKKDTVEICPSVSITFLKKHGYLSPQCCQSGRISWKNYYDEVTGSIGIMVSTFEGESFVRFYYTVTDRNTGEKTDYDYKVSLTTTPCNFGGVRYWFICPLNKNGAYCGKRVAKLYEAPGAVYFGCRHCYDLSYDSRNKSRCSWIGQLGYAMDLDMQIEKLKSQVKRNFYDGRPTKKFRRLVMMRNRLNAYMDSPAMAKLKHG